VLAIPTGQQATATCHHRITAAGPATTPNANTYLLNPNPNPALEAGPRPGRLLHIAQNVAGHGHDHHRLSLNDVDVKIAQRLSVAGRPMSSYIQHMVIQIRIRLLLATAKREEVARLVLVPVRIAVLAAAQKGVGKGDIALHRKCLRISNGLFLTTLCQYLRATARRDKETRKIDMRTSPFTRTSIVFAEMCHIPFLFRNLFLNLCRYRCPLRLQYPPTVYESAHHRIGLHQT